MAGLNYWNGIYSNYSTELIVWFCYCLEGATSDILDNRTCQRQTSHSFSSAACDQVMEQTYNRDSKVRGGLVGFTLNRSAVHRWIVATFRNKTAV